MISYKSGSRRLHLELRQTDPTKGGELVHKFTMNGPQTSDLVPVLPELMSEFEKIMSGKTGLKKVLYFSNVRVAVSDPYWCVNFSKWEGNRLAEKMSLKIHEFRDLMSFFDDDQVRRVLGNATKETV